MLLENIKDILQYKNISIPNNILYDIELGIRNNTYINNHVSFLIDQKTNSIITYGFNYYLKSNKFPFSLHSEINTINKYYKKNLNRAITKSKKILIILKISKTGIIGNSKPCFNCANFIYNNYNNLNLANIYYSSPCNKLVLLMKKDFKKNIFKRSSGFKESSNT